VSRKIFSEGMGDMTGDQAADGGGDAECRSLDLSRGSLRRQKR
jgi:hypothetical protein